jgi:FixJ family two-component response regulator
MCASQNYVPVNFGRLPKYLCRDLRYRPWNEYRPQATVEMLSSREWQIMIQVATGRLNKQIVGDIKSTRRLSHQLDEKHTGPFASRTSAERRTS